jgi:hypothetical protein
VSNIDLSEDLELIHLYLHQHNKTFSDPKVIKEIVLCCEVHNVFLWEGYQSCPLRIGSWALPTEIVQALAKKWRKLSLPTVLKPRKQRINLEPLVRDLSKVVVPLRSSTMLDEF